VLERCRRGGPQAGSAGGAVARRALLLAGSTSRRRSVSATPPRRRGWAERLGRQRNVRRPRAGTERGWGVANRLRRRDQLRRGRARRRHARFPALGRSRATGGEGSTSASQPGLGRWRSGDGRGPKTEARAARAGALRPADADGARGGDPRRRIRRGACSSSPPLVLRRGGARRRRGGIVDGSRRGRRAGARGADAARADERAVEVVLGGGLLGTRRRLLDAIVAGSREVGPGSGAADGSPPVVGAALLGLDELGRTARRRPARASASARRADPDDAGGRAMADVRFVAGDADLPGHGRAGRSMRSTSHIAGRRVCRPRRPSGSGKTTGAAHARGSRRSTRARC
jgi:hypothetical protein